MRLRNSSGAWYGHGARDSPAIKGGAVIYRGPGTSLPTPQGPACPCLPCKVLFDFSLAEFTGHIHHQKRPRNVACWVSRAKGRPREPHGMRRGQSVTRPGWGSALDPSCRRALRGGHQDPEASCCVTLWNLLTSLGVTILTSSLLGQESAGTAVITNMLEVMTLLKPTDVCT